MSTASPQALASSKLKARSITLLVLAEISAMSLWFVSSAVVGDMTRSVSLSTAASAILSSSVPAGFVVGALGSAFIGLADRLDPRRVFALSVVFAAVANLLTLWVSVGSASAVILRFLTGLFLAGVYPVGMKIAIGWGTRDRGWLVGLVVGGLTLGSAAPHLLAYLGGANWQLTTVLASGIALLAAIMIMLTGLGPHHAIAPRFDPATISLAWADRRIRRAYAGYLGHMWELYAMWAWIGVAVTASYAVQMEPERARALGKLVAFFTIAGGALLCPLAGKLADRLGKARTTIVFMVLSGASAVIAAGSFGGSVGVFTLAVLLWGLSVIPDSAQFSALIADFAPPEKAGSLMTLQTACGFALTIITVQATPWLATQIGWPGVFLVLACGPAFGVWSMWALQAEAPESAA